jgi:hypothetical protein
MYYITKIRYKILITQLFFTSARSGSIQPFSTAPFTSPEAFAKMDSMELCATSVELSVSSSFLDNIFSP